MSRRRIRAIFRKELREYRRNRSLILGMAVIPLVFLAQPLVSVFNSFDSSQSLMRRRRLSYRPK